MLIRLVSFIACVAVTAHCQDSSLKKGTVCWPLHFAGITVGLSTDSEARRLLGDGVARRDEGDTGGRYFTNQSHTATLHIVSYTDSVIGELTFKQGVDATLKGEELRRAETKWFDGNGGFGNWHALHLGSSRAEVLKNLGEPMKKPSASDWRYETVCECELPEFFDIFFRGDRIVKVTFSAPSG